MLLLRHQANHMFYICTCICALTMEAIWPIFDFSKIKQHEKVVYVSLFKQNTFNFGETNSAASLFIQSS